MSSSITHRVTERALARRVARRHAAGEPQVLKGLLEEAEKELKKYEAWGAAFPATLSHAEAMSADLAPGFVWQDDLVDYWAPFTSIQRELLTILDDVIDLDQGRLGDQVEADLDPPAAAQIEFAIEEPKFFDRPGYDRKQIAYSTQRLKAWHQNFVRWIRGALRRVRARVSML